MYSLEQRKRAVELYIKYGLKATATIRELGYPSRAQLVSWHREWQENGGRLTDRSLEHYTEIEFTPLSLTYRFPDIVSGERNG